MSDQDIGALAQKLEFLQEELEASQIRENSLKLHNQSLTKLLHSQDSSYLENEAIEELRNAQE